MPQLIIGGQGFLGSHLARRLVQEGERPLLLDLAPHSRLLKPLKGKVECIRGDVRLLANLIDAIKGREVDTVFHLAAIISQAAEERPLHSYEVNFTGTLNVLEACRLMGVKRVIYASSMAAYGPKSGSGPLREEEPKEPTTSYGISKVFSELWGLYYARRYSLDFRALRFPTLIGPGRGWSTFAYTSFMIERAALREPWAIPVEPSIRTPIAYVKDAVRALLRLWEEEEPKSRIYNLGSLYPSAEEVLDTIRRFIPDAPLRFSPDAELSRLIGERSPPPLDDAKIREELGLQLAFDLSTLVEDFIGEVESDRSLYEG